MKQLVDEATMREALDAFYAASAEERDALRARCGSFQQELTGFVLAYGMDLPDQERAMTLALLPVIYDAFVRTGAAFRQVRSGEIMHAWKASTAFVRDLKRAEDGCYAEPEVMDVVINIVLEKDPATLVSDAPPLIAVRILQTAVECLNRAGVVRPPRR